jgi:hypothetical protein
MKDLIYEIDLAKINNFSWMKYYSQSEFPYLNAGINVRGV